MSKPELEWDEAALARINKAPFFIRPLARRKVESAAREKGMKRITLEFVESIKKQEMGR